MNSKSLVIMFDNAPSMHKEGILELIAKSNDLLIFHCASQRDKRHPSEVFTSKDIFSKSRFKLNSSIRNKEIKKDILKILSSQNYVRKDLKIKIIYSFLDFKRLCLVLLLKKHFEKFSSDVSLFPLYEPIRFNDIIFPLRLIKISLSLILQRLFLNPQKLYCFSSLNCFYYKLFFSNLEIIPYQQSSTYIKKCNRLKKISKSKNYSILFIGKLINRKNPLLLLKACLELNFKNDLTIVGDGFLKEKLKKFYDRNKNKGKTKLKFIKNIDNNKIPILLKENDVLVLPSRFDGFGFVVAEAIYCNTYVIVSSQVGSQDLIKQGINGSIFQNNSKEELKNHLTMQYMKTKIFL